MITTTIQIREDFISGDFIFTKKIVDSVIGKITKLGFIATRKWMMSTPSYQEIADKLKISVQELQDCINQMNSIQLPNRTVWSKCPMPCSGQAPRDQWHDDADMSTRLFMKDRSGKLWVPTDEVVVHKLGSIKVVMRRTVNGIPMVEIYQNDKRIASSYTVEGAFTQARQHIPRKPKVVHEEIFAIRGWHLIGDLLIPMTRETDWETWAGPVAKSHTKPDDSNSAGLYCTKLKHDLVDEFVSQYRPHVYGIVGLLGRVLEYEKGYRAERAVVRLLSVILPVTDITMKALGERYQCQVSRSKVVKPEDVGY